MYGVVEVLLHVFLVSTLDGCERSISRRGRLTREEIPHGNYWIGSWVGPRAGLNWMPKKENLYII
jgi:hypothetical protein